MAPSALILYGSETGTAQDGAEEIAGMLSRQRFATELLAFDQVQAQNLVGYALVVGVISTTGQGELPVNAKTFWKGLLRKRLPGNYLASVQFAVFGFGDSSYPKFNYAALKLQKRLVQLGAHEFVPLGRGDAQHPEGHDATFIPWIGGLRDRLLELFPLEDGQEPIADDVLLEPQWLLALDDGQRGTDAAPACIHVASSPSQSPASHASHNLRHLDVVLKANKRVTADKHWQDVRHLTFSSSTEAPYMPGDVLVIYPRNPMEDVDQIIALMDWGDVADLPLVFTRNPGCHIPSKSRAPSFATLSEAGPTSLRDLLHRHLDLNAIPRRSFFGMIAHFTKDDFQRTRLLEFINPEFLDELYDYTTRPRRSTLEVLQEFDTVKIPWQWAAAVLPVLRGRQFSIASGGTIARGPGSSTRIELLVAIVKYRTVIRKLRRGVCTRYLESLEPGSPLSVTLQKGGLSITAADTTRPTVLVGPGTGVAPIRALLWQRLEWNAGNTTEPASGDAVDHPPGRNLLFFGCRNKEADFFFQDEWDELRGKMPLDVFPSFSRDQAQKQYVQDAIRANSRPIHSALCEQNGIVFICGSSGKMPQAVREALTEVIEKESSVSRETAHAYIVGMEKANRYKQETW